MDPARIDPAALFEGATTPFTRKANPVIAPQRTTPGVFAPSLNPPLTLSLYPSTKERLPFLNERWGMKGR